MYHDLLKTRDLRVGNVVRVADVISKVAEIRGGDVRLEQQRYCEAWQCRPIALDALSLAACGFGCEEAADGGAVYIHTKNDVEVHLCGGVMFPSFQYGAFHIGNPVRYVHQLQNIVHALTGDELDIDIEAIADGCKECNSVKTDNKLYWKPTER